jgi:hypothetical protein
VPDRLPQLQLQRRGRPTHLPARGRVPLMLVSIVVVETLVLARALGGRRRVAPQPCRDPPASAGAGRGAGTTPRSR